MTPREQFLQRVRQAVAAGNDAAHSGGAPAGAPPLPERKRLEPGRTASLDRFCAELTSAGGKGHIAADRDGLCRTMHGIIRSHDARKILLSRGGVVERLDVSAWLRERGLEVTTTDSLARADPRVDLFAAEIGISNVHCLIAETGTVVMSSRPNEPRSVSLLPPVHIALADRSQLLPDLYDLFDLFSPLSSDIPSCLTLITGPSKTGDIELKLVTGVHGPGEIHVIVCDW
jgi:L-lactate utilization protein LutC